MLKTHETTKTYQQKLFKISMIFGCDRKLLVFSTSCLKIPKKITCFELPPFFNAYGFCYISEHVYRLSEGIHHLALLDFEMVEFLHNLNVTMISLVFGRRIPVTWWCSAAIMPRPGFRVRGNIQMGNTGGR